MKKISGLMLCSILALGNGTALYAGLPDSGFSPALANVGKFKGRKRRLPDVEEPRYVHQLLEQWHFENCKELVSDGDKGGELTVEKDGAYPEFGTMLAERAALGTANGRSVKFSVRDLDYVYFLNSEQPAFQGNGIQRWEGLIRVQGADGYFGAGTPAWMTYQEEKTSEGLRATFTVQVMGHDADGTAVIRYEKYSSDGRMISLGASKSPEGIVRYRTESACGDAFGFPFKSESQQTSVGELTTLKFDVMKAANEAVYGRK